MTVVYLDRVFLLNSVVDYLLFYVPQGFCGFPLHQKAADFLRGAGRRLRGCGLYFRACIFGSPGAPIGLWRLAGACRVSPFPPGPHIFFAFGRPRRHPAGPRPGLWLGGGTGTAVYYADVSWQALILVSILFYVLLRLFAGQAARHGGGELLQIKVSVGGRIQTVTALDDTGNTLGIRLPGVRRW